MSCFPIYDVYERKFGVSWVHWTSVHTTSSLIYHTEGIGNFWQSFVLPKKFLWLRSLIISPMVLVVPPLSPWVITGSCFRSLLSGRHPALSHPPELRHGVHQERRRRPGNQEKTTVGVQPGDVGAPRPPRLPPPPGELPPGQTTAPLPSPGRAAPGRALHQEAEEPQQPLDWSSGPPAQVQPPQAEVRELAFLKLYLQSNLIYGLLLALVLHKGSNWRPKIVNCVNMWSLKCPDLT